MSSFSDNFSRDDNKETQYDDSAFHTFAGTVLLVSIITILYLLYRRLFYSKELSKKKYRNCQCGSCKERLTRHYNKLHKQNINFTFFFMIILIIGLSYLFYLSYGEIVRNGSNFKRFDPYEILEISPGADEKEIKKAYRKLTLKYHPDKNRNDLQAKAKFIMIAKAYESLTDEVARKNFEMYGNPDGPGSMRLAVGLPSFVLNKKNHMPILTIFLIFIVIIIPAFVWFWFSTSNKYDESGSRIEDQGIFYHLLNENILLRQMPFVLGAALEYSNLKYKTNDEELFKLWKSHLEKMPKHNESNIPDGNKRAIGLIYAFVHNHQFNTPEMQEDIANILRPAPQLLMNMYKMSIELSNMHQFNKNIKFFGYGCVKTILEFSQIIHQKLSISNLKESSPFFQLPHFNQDNITKFKFTTKKSEVEDLKSLNTLSNFITRRTSEERKQLLTTVFNDTEVQDIENACQMLPVYNLKVETFVDGFGEELIMDDICTIKVTIERANISENQELGLAHSNSFRDVFQEKVALFIKYQDTRIIYETILDITQRVTVQEFKHPVREIGNFEFKAELVSLNYRGIDLNEKFMLETKKTSQKRKDFLENIEKREIKKLEPSYFQQMINQVFPNDEDEEEEEETETNNESTEKQDEETEKKHEEQTEEKKKAAEEKLLEETVDELPSKNRRNKKKTN